MALLVAACLAGAYAPRPPDVEVQTLGIFCAGVLLGARDGAWVGGLTMLVYSLMNPYGPAHPLVTGAQVLGQVPAGLAGGAFGALGLHARSVAARGVALGVLAFVLTLWFDLVTNLATGLLMGQWRVVLVGGAWFALWHNGSNVLLFVLLGTPLVGVFGRYRARLSS
ncbi:MAG TPA: hypothetical protein VMS88_04475 [Terriglobales bacterium]|nr:hypothetical protein [Terriglobales bacterium]